jgi:DNA-binding NarL/FixJ family response regulator
VKILVVDDSAVVRSRLVAMLAEQPGVTCVDEASDVTAALALLAKSPPAVVVLDLHLPGRNGFVVLEALARMAPRPYSIVLTNDPTEQHRKQSMTLGADRFFDKSSDFDRVAALVVELAARR